MPSFAVVYMHDKMSIYILLIGFLLGTYASR